jgi:hypothetical protein
MKLEELTPEKSPGAQKLQSYTEVLQFIAGSREDCIDNPAENPLNYGFLI